MNDILVTVNKVFDINFIVPVFLMVLLTMMILPLPALMLDVLFTFNIVFAIVVVLATVYCRRPLEFAVFPTVILISTLFRLALNVASTRVVLLKGHTGTEAAGQVIESFGQVVIGGNYTVGLVVFFILVVINFVVITKGAGRISEVSARFTLDGLPGKQMSIDADLNAGLLTQEEAKLKREELSDESDFYGSMDGASKFVRGDAVAGVIILLINLIGGLIIGISQHGMSLFDASQNYVLLTIGDGIAAQVPALLISSAAAIMVTRFSKPQDMSQAIVSQVFSNKRSFGVAALILLFLGIIPNMPHFVFLSFALMLGFMAVIAKEQTVVELPRSSQGMLSKNTNYDDREDQDLLLEEISGVDPICLELGYRLIPIINDNAQNELISRIKELRKALSNKYGFLIPMVRIKDNLNLEPTSYRIKISGVSVSDGELCLDKSIALVNNNNSGTIDGKLLCDKALGLKGYWIDSSLRDRAMNQNFTVINSSDFITLNLSLLIENNLDKLFGYDETQLLLNKLSSSSSSLVSELVPTLLSTSVVTTILQSLLMEKVPLTDFRKIIETLAEHAADTKHPDELLAYVRMALSGLITQELTNESNKLAIVVLAPPLEQAMIKLLENNRSELVGSSLIEHIQRSLHLQLRDDYFKKEPYVLVVDKRVRSILARLLHVISIKVHVLSFDEIANLKKISITGTISE